MKVFIKKITAVSPSSKIFDLGMLLFRVAVSLQLMAAHGLKKIGVGEAVVEQVPNPLHLPDLINQGFAIASNLFFPVFVILGLLTRLAILPVLAVTLTGYFVLHWNDALQVKDVPFIYSVVFILIWVLGPGRYSIDYIINRKLKS